MSHWRSMNVSVTVSFIVENSLIESCGAGHREHDQRAADEGTKYQPFQSPRRGAKLGAVNDLTTIGQRRPTT
jgi:hypothetical protein